jgi:hypothetical protein
VGDADPVVIQVTKGPALDDPLMAEGVAVHLLRAVITGLEPNVMYKFKVQVRGAQKRRSMPRPVAP